MIVNPEYEDDDVVFVSETKKSPELNVETRKREEPAESTKLGKPRELSTGTLSISMEMRGKATETSDEETTSPVSVDSRGRDIMLINDFFLTPAEKLEKRKILAARKAEETAKLVKPDESTPIHAFFQPRVRTDTAGWHQEERKLRDSDLLEVVLPLDYQQHVGRVMNGEEKGQDVFSIKPKQSHELSTTSFSNPINLTQETISSDTPKTISLDQVKREISNHYTKALSHPACKSLMNQIGKHKKTHQLWTEKYAPIHSEKILSNQDDLAHEISSWLHWYRLTTSPPKTKPKKKKKKHDLDDDFINDDTDDEGAPNIKSSILLLVGPPGCGKSAMIHASATQHGYQVMEMNPGQRRSGKEVMAQVGDAVVNYGVSGKHGAAEKSKPKVKKVKKGAMDAFLKKRPLSSDDDSPPPPPVLSPGKVTQTVIVFEEVDILFEADKGFFATVATLAQKSKRPIILTANDAMIIDHLPVELVNEVSIRTMTYPDVNLLQCYLQLIAACEGVWMEPKVVNMIAKICGHDIRKSLMTMEWLCLGDEIKDGFRTVPKKALYQLVGQASCLRHHFDTNAFEMTNLGVGIADGVFTMLEEGAEWSKVVNFSEIMSFSQLMERDVMNHFMNREPDVYVGDSQDDVTIVSYFKKPDYRIMYGLNYVDDVLKDDCIDTLHNLSLEALDKQQDLDWIIEFYSRLGSGLEEPGWWIRQRHVMEAQSWSTISRLLTEDVSYGQPTAVHVDYLPWIRYLISHENSYRDLEFEASAKGRRARGLPPRHLHLGIQAILDLMKEPEKPMG